jgi:excisionase family DNA binding protein
LANLPAASESLGETLDSRGGEAMTELRKPPVSEKSEVPVFGPGAAPLLDSNQAAQFLGVHPRTLQRMVLRGEIAAVKVGKLWRFVPSAIQEWVTQHSIAS